MLLMEMCLLNNCVDLWVWNCEYGPVNMDLWVWTCECGPVSVELWVWTCECGPVNVDLWVWICECGPVNVDLWMWICECRPVNVDLWVWICEYEPVNVDLWMWICECEPVNVDLWIWICEWKLNSTLLGALMEIENWQLQAICVWNECATFLSTAENLQENWTSEIQWMNVFLTNLLESRIAESLKFSYHILI
jgi:hypothetical protein